MPRSRTLSLFDVVARRPDPEPWSEGESIPWSDPDFSRRMLREHLSQAHDRASRREAIVGRQVTWLHEDLLGARASRVLDLGCGPGLYTSRLAVRGHDCTGVDFSPASLRYAREQARERDLACEYVEADLRQHELGTGFDLILILFGELHVFRSEVARSIFERAARALVPGGALLLELHPFEAVRRRGQEPAVWHSAESGLFADDAYLCLQESFWREREAVATRRYFTITTSGQVERMAESLQAYREEELFRLLATCGFETIAPAPWPTGGDPDLYGLVARTGGART